VETDYFAIVESNSGTGPSAGTVLTYADGLRITIDSTSQITVGYDNATNFGTGGTNSIRVYSRISCSNWQHKTKTLTETTYTELDPQNTDEIVLPNIDGYKIISITGTDTDTSTDYDLISYYDYDLGQKDDIYDFIRLTKTTDIDVSIDEVVITYSYFARSGSGFFSVDSYTNSGLSYSEIPSYTSSIGEKYQLSDVLDFRFDVNTTTTLINDIYPVINEDLNYDYSYYLPRRDKIVVSKNGIKVVEGISSLKPEYPKTPDNSMLLYTIDIEPYTYGVSSVEFTYIDNRRYTMKDIANIDQRVDRVEYYTALSLLEKQAQETKIASSTPGLDKFKSGIIVDPFDSYFVGDLKNSDFKCSIDAENRTLRPAYSSYLDKFTVDSNTNLTINDNIVTLGYTETPCFSQNLTSRVRNLNPNSHQSWIGNLSLFPSSDSWVDESQKTTKVVNRTKTLSPPTGVYYGSVAYNKWKNSLNLSAIQSDLEESYEEKLYLKDAKNEQKYNERLSKGKKIPKNWESPNKEYTDEWVRAQTIRFVSKGHLPDTELTLNVNGNLLDYSANIELVLEDDVTDLTCDEVYISNYITAKIANVHNNRIFIHSLSNNLTNSSDIPIEIKKNGVTIQTSTINNTILEQGLITNDFGVICGQVIIPAKTIKSGTVDFKLFDNTGISSSSTTFISSGTIKVSTEYDVKYTIKLAKPTEPVIDTVETPTVEVSPPPTSDTLPGKVGKIGRLTTPTTGAWYNHTGSFSWEPNYYSAPYPFFKETSSGWAVSVIWDVVFKPRPSSTTEQNGWTDNYSFDLRFPEFNVTYVSSLISKTSGILITPIWKMSPTFGQQLKTLTINYNESIAGTTASKNSKKMQNYNGEPLINLMMSINSSDNPDISFEDIKANPSKYLPFLSSKHPTISHELYEPDVPVSINPVTKVTDVEVTIENTNTIPVSHTIVNPVADTATTVVEISPAKVLRINSMEAWIVNPSEYTTSNYDKTPEYSRTYTSPSKIISVGYNNIDINYRYYYIQYRLNVQVNYSSTFDIVTTSTLINTEVVSYDNKNSVISNTWTSSRTLWGDKPYGTIYSENGLQIVDESQVIVLRVPINSTNSSIILSHTITDTNDGSISSSYTSSKFNLFERKITSYEL